MTDCSLVTGGSGFIGRHLVKELLNTGERVRILDIKQPDRAVEKDVEFIQGSILDRRKVSEALKGVKWIFHLAANPQLWAYHRHEFFKVNYQGTRIVLEEAKKVPLEKMVYTSTEAILRGYRDKNPVPVNEDQPLPAVKDLAGPYSRSKLMADQAVQEAAWQGFPAVLVNPTIPVGPGDANLTPPTSMIMNFMNGKNPAYIEVTLNLIPVKDVAVGHVMAARKGKPGERYILGNEDLLLSRILQIIESRFNLKMPTLKLPYWVAYLTTYISEGFANYITRRPPVASLEGTRIAVAGMRFDSTKAQRELKLPKSSVEEALVAAGNWLIEYGLVKVRGRHAH